MLVYKFDENGLFVGSDETDIDQLESKSRGYPVYLLPPNTTFDKPEERVGYAPVWDGSKWVYVEDFRGKEYWLPEDKYGAGARVMNELGSMPIGAMFTPPEMSDEEKQAQALAQAKAERAMAVEALTVEVEGMVFDADEVSQQRVARSIVALQEGETMPWVLYDNTIVQVNKSQLMQVLRLAGQKQCELWVKPYTG